MLPQIGPPLTRLPAQTALAMVAVKPARERSVALVLTPVDFKPLDVSFLPGVVARHPADAKFAPRHAADQDHNQFRRNIALEIIGDHDSQRPRGRLPVVSSSLDIVMDSTASHCKTGSYFIPDAKTVRLAPPGMEPVC
ncbi:hypothetical protein [uncultured Hoeflea sp.]|uniref:hypothetical protein n=1 Tax=uncultured Hoeflea sp. TaxID=538666 RepID=UPI0030DD3E85